jgi:hypothetical protein
MAHSLNEKLFHSYLGFIFMSVEKTEQRCAETKKEQVFFFLLFTDESPSKN